MTAYRLHVMSEEELEEREQGQREIDALPNWTWALIAVVFAFFLTLGILFIPVVIILQVLEATR